MPELQLFRRRWHIATDALPLMMALLCIFHVLWFVPYATGAWSIEGTGLRYECSHATELRLANYSLFALFGLAAINEAVLTVMGLRGGPFETKKRRPMTPLLYLEIALWVLLLGFTVYATVVVYSPEVSDACWSNNPCAYNPDIFPLVCRDKGGSGIRELDPACQVLVDLGPDLFQCFLTWLGLGANWATETVNLFDNFDAEFSANLTLSGEHGITSGREVHANAADRLILGWLVCQLLESGSIASPEDLFTGTTATDEVLDAADEAWWDALRVDPNCTDILDQWQQRFGVDTCNNTYDPATWNSTLGLELEFDMDTSPGYAKGSEGNLYFSFPGVTNRQEYNAFLLQHPNLFQYMSSQFLQTIDATTLNQLRTGVTLAPNLTKGSDAPWYKCLDDECQEVLDMADNCTAWAQILALPNPKNRKRFFEVLVITSWSVLGVTALVVFICFNAFPDYNDVDSWEGTVRSIDRMCLCGGGLSGFASVSGSDMSVSHEIAKSLNLLFGGADMDPTDRLLGIYLVSERQHRRRQQDVLAALEDAGFPMRRKPQGSRFMQAISRLASMGRRSQQQTIQPSSNSSRVVGAAAGASGSNSSFCGDEADAPQAVRLSHGTAAATTTRADDSSAAATAAAAVQVAAGKLPLSPFAAPGAPLAPQRQLLGQDARLMLYQHSMIRLASSLVRGNSSRNLIDSLVAAEAGKAASKGQAAALDGDAEPEHVLEEPEQAALSGSMQHNGTSQNGTPSRQKGSSWQNRGIRVVARYTPLLTPSGCASSGVPASTPLSPQAAADIYAGRLDAVDQGTLREAQRISRFAVAAYGLQGVIWAQGKRPGMCLANANRLVKCFKKPLGLENKFRKRNFDAILSITGLQPADLLYVSYANVAGGVLPYLIMLHRPSKSVVLSVRGTVSMEDLITDLLSNPVDVAGWVPEWVRQEAQRRQAAGIAGGASGDGLKAHIGIVSSATAILKDMENRGLLREMLLSKLLRTATLTGRNSQDVVAEFLEANKGSVPQVPMQQQAASRKGMLGSDPVATAASGQGLVDVDGRLGSRSLAEEGEAEQPQFQAAEVRHLSSLNAMSQEREVDLPLERAQTILRSKLQQQGWKVVVTGHSLGAAVACMLGMQLRERFADLQCWAFNPPGGLVSWDLAQIAQRYCTSIVVGKDLISRLSFNTSKRVVDEMVVSLARCKRPKLKILFDVMLGRWKRSGSMPHTFCQFGEISPEALKLVEQYYRASHLHMQTADTTEMYPPGKLVFFRPFKGKRKQQTVWDAVWIDAAALISEGILVTPSMMAHHRLFMLSEAFESILAGEAATQAAAQDEQGQEDVVRL